MIKIRHREDRGQTKIDWLDSRHTFSFGDYHDSLHMGYRSLRVINEDFVAPGAGFPTHGHRDMEILTYILEGTLQHADSMGTGSTISTGEVQRMTAGTGVTHSEFNASKTKKVHLLQIWILPEKKGLTPGYEQRSFSPEKFLNQWCLIASGPHREKGDAVFIHQDVKLFASRLDADHSIEYEPKPNRHLWLQVARGEIHFKDFSLEAGDGAIFERERKIVFKAGEKGAEALLFDLS